MSDDRCRCLKSLNILCLIIARTTIAADSGHEAL